MRNKSSQVTTTRSLSQWYEPIVFTLKDEEGMTFAHEDALVISTVIFNHKIHRALVDDDSTTNILSVEVMV
jgi:ssRNA-specific RNase YbeY (16S rRNA maturation enzyme)